VAPRFVAPATATVSCFVSDAKSERTRNTWPNSGCTRDAVRLVAPVDGTIESAGTYTGRFASSVSAKRVVPTRFKSRKPYWLCPRAELASTVNEKAPPRCIGPGDARQACGAVNRGSYVVTSGRGVVAPLVESAQRDGMAAGLASRSEEHTSALPSRFGISYAVF